MIRSETPLILAVDDTPENLKLLAEILETYEYDAAFAMDGLEALTFVQQEKPELILLDVLMPGMDGFEVCRRLKADPTTAAIPVIFLTAKTETEDIVKGFEVGAVDYVTKPFKIAELIARVRTHVELFRARVEIRTLRGMLPTCAHCKKIRDDQGKWQPIEVYISDRTEAEFSHGYCPTCQAVYFPDFTNAQKQNPD
ncbi:MAG: response regulator [Holophaga sp.]|nr:response regulator [Holophaga sp.]